MKIKNWWAALMGAALLSGCGGGGSDSAVSQTSSPGYQVGSGVAQKGPLLRGSWISVNELSESTLQPAGTSFNFEVADNYGTFNPSGITFSARYAESTAMGYYFDELAGKTSSEIVILRALSDLSSDRAINVNILTDLSNARIRALVTDPASPQSFGAARLSAQRDVLRAFFINNSSDLLPGGDNDPANFGELDLSKNRNADQMLAAISAVVTRIAKTSGGINQFINEFEADLADDGNFNNSPNFTLGPLTRIKWGVKGVDWDALALNLNTFYKTTRYTAADLKQWVDTSGDVDKVIDRYKASVSDVPAGTPSLSPEYVAGTEDANRCFSATEGTLYRNGSAVSGATVKAAKGDRFQLELTGTTPGQTLAGFIQRSAPAAGVCPATAPTTGLTRLFKWTVGTLAIPE